MNWKLLRYQCIKIGMMKEPLQDHMTKLDVEDAGRFQLLQHVKLWLIYLAMIEL